MGQTKTLGEQLDVQDVSTDIANNTTAITTVANGLTTDLGSRDVLYEDFVYNEIDEEVNNSVIADVFIYDTSLDDDDGEWTTTSTHQSWYNETLNTATRGATKHFPKLALIVVQRDKIIIYDAGDSSLPMWMVFEVDWSFDTKYIVASYTNQISQITMLNGTMYVGIVGDDIGFKTVIVNFIEDSGYLITNYISTGGDHTVPISGRNGTDGYLHNNSITIIDRIRDLAVVSVGNGRNILYIAGMGGLYRIDPEGIVSEWSAALQNLPVGNLSISGDYVMWNSGTYVTSAYIHLQEFRNPLKESWDSDGSNHFDGRSIPTWNAERVPFSFNVLTMWQNDMTENALGSYYALTKLYPEPSNWGSSMVANITSDWNSGIMHGDIRGAWMSDTTEEVIGVDGTVELITNGGFTNGTTGWNAVNGALLTIVGGKIRVENTGTNYPIAVQVVYGLVVGQTYKVTVDAFDETGIVRVDVNWFGYDGNGNVTDGYYVFRAPTTEINIELFCLTTVLGQYSEFDNVSITRTSELIDNGTFNARPDGWTVSNNADLSIVNGRLRVAYIDVANPAALQVITGLVIGETYTVTADVFNGTATARADLEHDGNDGVDNLTDGEHTFIATSTIAEIQLFASASSAGYAEFDNISIRIADPDRSHNVKGLQVHGQITKSPVALGSELMGYSGFSQDNYLEQAYNPDLNFGTGDFYVMGWVQGNDISYRTIIQRDEDPINNNNTIHIDTGVTNNWRIIAGGVATSIIPLIDGVWSFICAVRVNNILMVYTNAIPAGTSSSFSNLDSTFAITRLGLQVVPVGTENNRPQTLIRMGAGAPTAEQISTIYEQEKPMFDAGSKVTLQGTSNDVKAVDYDKSNNVLTACSADHITKFNDLVVVDDRAGVVTSISTKYGKELTGA